MVAIEFLQRLDGLNPLVQCGSLPFPLLGEAFRPNLRAHAAVSGEPRRSFIQRGELDHFYDDPDRHPDEPGDFSSGP